jgi:hypothetical protein
VLLDRGPLGFNRLGVTEIFVFVARLLFGEFWIMGRKLKSI